MDHVPRERGIARLAQLPDRTPPWVSRQGRAAGWTNELPREGVHGAAGGVRAEVTWKNSSEKRKGKRDREYGAKDKEKMGERRKGIRQKAKEGKRERREEGENRKRGGKSKTENGEKEEREIKTTRAITEERNRGKSFKHELSFGPATS